MKTLVAAARDFARDEEGITAIEYGLIAAVMAGVVSAAFGPLKKGIVDAFGAIVDQMKGGTAPTTP
jgi:pilus assembly protein Flp/PilA